MSKLIPLTQGKFAIVDNEDYERINQYKWCAAKFRNTFYAMRCIHKNGKYTTITMHREILFEIPVGFQIDHINHNGLDNRRSNLRICVTAQNHYNRIKMPNKSSQYKGVSWSKNSKKWEAYIQKTHLGYYENEIDAALTYNEKAKERFGDFAHLNIV